MKLITKKQEEKMKEGMIRKLMFAIIYPVDRNVGVREARLIAENLYCVDGVILPKEE